MTETNEKKDCFLIHGFMGALGLSASELLVYAIIFSYSLGKEEMFYGSLDYIAERTGVARRTVNSAVKKLMEEGLISRRERSGKIGLSADLNRIKHKDSSPSSSGDKRLEKEPRGKELAEQRKKPTPGRFLFPDANTGKTYDTEPMYQLITVGSDKAVKMTLEQYDKLKSLIPDIDLKRYIDRLAAIHIERGGGNTHWRKSDYRIIREWIKEDFSA